MLRPLIAANWKMNKLQRDALVFVEMLLLNLEHQADCEILICPPFTSLGAVGQALEGSSLMLGAQDVYWEKQGAFTGEISADMLVDCGCGYVIIGHSERRGLMGESDEDVNRKVQAALAVSLVPIICVGETLEQRENGLTGEIVTSQLRAALKGCSLVEGPVPVVAYEPVWAIGSGCSASSADAQEVASLLKQVFEEMAVRSEAAPRILYGGSVKATNIADFMGEEGVDGALVGGASLDSDEFARLIAAAVRREQP